MLKNLIDSWDWLTQKWSEKYIILLLDYDGTLTPIASNPSQAFLSEENRELIEGLTQMPRLMVVIVSGRTLEDLKKMTGIKGVLHIGNHGWQIDGASLKFENFVPVEYTSLMDKIKYELITQLSDIQGAFVEDKGVNLSVHFRQVAPEKENTVKRIFDSICMPYRRKNLLKINAGKKVLELKPPLEWDKGKAILWLLKKQELIKGTGKVLPIYIGDDSTDEDAFKALKNKGITVYVGTTPMFSAAQYSLAGPQQVTELLKHMTSYLKC